MEEGEGGNNGKARQSTYCTGLNETAKDRKKVRAIEERKTEQHIGRNIKKNRKKDRET